MDKFIIKTLTKKSVNELIGNELIGNELIGNELIGNPIGNELIGNELIGNSFICFTDGSTFNNGKKNKKQYGGIGIYYYLENSNDFKPEKISVSLNNNDKITNNIAELKAIIKAINLIVNNKYYSNNLIKLYTDSEYVIKSITLWSKNWAKHDWCKYDTKTKKYKPIKNKELIINLYNLYLKYNIKLIHIKAHQTEPKDKNSITYKLWYGNNIADKLAVKGSKSVIN